MELDPSRWLVSLAGFFYDWMITREWKRVFLGFLPLGVLAVVVGLVWVGSQLDNSRLANWYLELGDQEIADWEQAWAPTKSNQESASQESSGEAESSDVPAGVAMASMTERKDLSRFTETLFRRVQLLEPSKRSQFVIGAILAQRGATEQAIRMLTEIAPDASAGYAPAHAFLAMIYGRDRSKSSSAELAALIKHHSDVAAGWDRAPTEVLVASSNAKWRDNKNESLKVFEQAAERDEELNLQLALRANEAGAEHKDVRDAAIEKAEEIAKRRLEANAKDVDSRISLAEIMILKGSWDAGLNSVSRDASLQSAEDLIVEGLKLEQDSKLTRFLSEIYRQRFVDNLRRAGNKKADIGLLDKAMRIDPTNERVAEQVAMLARVGGSKPSQELLTMLQQFLAEGKATSLTHAWISEVYLLRGEFDKAIPHLEQVITRIPNSSAHLNNLAFVLADKYPDRLEEALQLAQRSVASASAKPNANFFDTLGIVYSKLGQTTESIAAFESAIRLEPNRVDFLTNVAAQYLKQGDEGMAAIYEARITAVNEALAKAEAEATEKTQPKTEASSTTGAADAPTTPIATEPTNAEADVGPAGEAVPSAPAAVESPAEATIDQTDSPSSAPVDGASPSDQ